MLTEQAIFKKKKSKTALLSYGNSRVLGLIYRIGLPSFLAAHRPARQKSTRFVKLQGISIVLHHDMYQKCDAFERFGPFQCRLEEDRLKSVCCTHPNHKSDTRAYLYLREETRRTRHSRSPASGSETRPVRAGLGNPRSPLACSAFVTHVTYFVSMGALCRDFL